MTCCSCVDNNRLLRSTNENLYRENENLRRRNTELDDALKKLNADYWREKTEAETLRQRIASLERDSYTAGADLIMSNDRLAAENARLKVALMNVRICLADA